MDRLKEELAEARAAKVAGRGSLETGALAKEVLERNEGVLVPGCVPFARLGCGRGLTCEGSAALDALREELWLVQGKL